MKTMKLLITSSLLLLTFLVNSQSYDIYVSDAGDFQNGPWQILKFDSNGQNPEVFINSDLSWPQDILFMKSSNIVLISNFGSGKISRYDATTGTYLDDFATGIGGPTRMKIGPDSLLYVLQWYGNGKVKRYNLNGTYIDDFTSSGVLESIGLDWDQSGNLYVSSHVGDLVQKFDTNGTDVGKFVNTNLAGPTDIWFDTNGDLLVSDYNGTAVKRFNANGIYQNDFLKGTGRSEGVAYLPNGNILIGNGATNSVKMFSSSGTYLKDLIPKGSGNLMNPNAIAVRKNNKVSVPELKKALDKVIHPTMGREFHINEQYLNTIKSVMVFNNMGSLVDSFTTETWAASFHSKGLYIMVIQFYDGSVFRQKVMVK